MSTKMNVPTLKVYSTSYPNGLEGPVVTPDKRRVAKNQVELHEMLRDMGALLIYDKQWIYIPFHAITCILRGKKLFSIPWPLVEDSGDVIDSTDQ